MKESPGWRVYRGRWEERPGKLNPGAILFSTVMGRKARCDKGELGERKESVRYQSRDLRHNLKSEPGL